LQKLKASPDNRPALLGVRLVARMPRARMRLVLLGLMTVIAAGCGKEIGDECLAGTDCATDGTRSCDTSSSQGYCTIQGCDFDTCPDEAVCIRFFTGNFVNRDCNPATEDSMQMGVIPTDDCSLDELCSLVGKCVPRSSEVRYCMRKCSDDSDCRDHYECRDLELMKEHGGEEVTRPGVPPTESTVKFCAGQPP